MQQVFTYSVEEFVYKNDMYEKADHNKLLLSLKSPDKSMQFVHLSLLKEKKFTPPGSFQICIINWHLYFSVDPVPGVAFTLGGG